LRSDRAEYDEVPNRNTPNNLRFDGNFQSFINISRKRLCGCASKETREVWNIIKDAIEKVEPELASRMVRECVYRGFCPERKRCCGYVNTAAYQKRLEEYRRFE
jgi:thymidylate synthase ThyX